MMFPKPPRRKRGQAYQREFKKMSVLVAERDDGLCRLCGRVANHVHHIVFRSNGGTNDIDNLICLCNECHQKAHGLNNGNEKEIRLHLKSLLE